MTAHYTDSTLGVFDGLFQSFYTNNKIENEGNFLNGVKDGIWEKWDSDGHMIDSSVYENGKIKYTKIYNNGSPVVIKDKEYDSSRIIKKENTLSENDTITAVFRGDWRRFLERSLSGFNPADNGAGKGTYTVYIGFTVDTDGLISHFVPLTNYGFGMGKKVIEIIKNGPGGSRRYIKAEK